MDPDFVVTELEAPTSFTDWSSFQARARVCNVGGSGASAGETRLVFSQDAVADTMDFVAATGWATYLSPGQCDWVDLWGAAPGSPPNAWYLIAQADAPDFVLEGDETNNSLALGPLGVGYGPDLVVKALSTPAVADSAFQASFQICNLGTDYAPGSDVTFYASTDTSIETSSSPNPDFMLGTSWVSSLSPGECRTEQASLWSGPWGEYVIGAVVDELGMQAELVTSNNTFVGGVMGFGYGPDLVVSAIDAPPS
ncbi:MAG: hypothetical protein KC933_31170, partial [Myxococcales bacterium]|nr:hypothetical protein [Myxococcales bacterium]